MIPRKIGDRSETVLYLKPFFECLIILKITIQKLKCPKFFDLKFSNVDRIGETKTRTKLESISTIFEQVTELRNFGIFRLS